MAANGSASIVKQCPRPKEGRSYGQDSKSTAQGSNYVLCGVLVDVVDVEV